jgi:DNA polymerase-3 subunit delta
MTYFFYGEDEWGLKEAIDKLVVRFGEKNSTDLDVIYIDGSNLSSETLKTEKMTVGFFQDKRLIIIEDLFANRKSIEVEKIVEVLARKEENTIIVVVEYKKIDRRTVLFKNLIKKTSHKDYSSPSGIELAERIRKRATLRNSKITPAIANELARILQNDTLRLKNEVDKLATLRFGDEIRKEDIEDLVIADLNPNIFNLTEQLARRNFQSSIKSFCQLSAAGINENYILTMITWQFRQLLIIRDLLDHGQKTAQGSGISPFVFNKSLPIASGYRFSELKKIYQLLLESDYAIKTGTLPTEFALKILAAKICY